ncbi:PREDICTED: protein O-linked-mannose beta-1,2-N-acetylglucosaminyltransferase 1-like [Amphimedon queenslandica]|uniref:Protein O-linked-mannose beta-1,2-N-acetylglucosaminyltransferase n=1 Tax=Amphimedon queenslandica TaxID=400682 RepID=A0A1X7TMC9_AMPQE|nr:PREDICTED: protein O-linked-mannose beta-1,2-N-acetylglucosaminyltransferase 1-like [Amphimedon queenslandica]|eukprot:XP_019858766.1 PREDICTED: protein O-linked-mannose beta-1,2-N-acetylglucosaminyltransferase 1-like [Amphimedon queenslandica]
MARMRCTQTIWIGFVVLMFLLNIIFIIDLTLHHSSKVPIKLVHEGPSKYITIKLVSSREMALISVDGESVYTAEAKRGMHIVVLNEMTGSVMASRVFDTYIPGGDDNLPAFLESLANGRIVCFTILDEGTFSLKDQAKDAIEKLGSRLVKSLKWRYTWGFVTIKGDRTLAEDIGRSDSLGTWGPQLNMHVNVPVFNGEGTHSIKCMWPDTPANKRRRVFCSKYEGYKDLCHCSKPSSISEGVPLAGNEVANLPVTIIASNRPQYLYRMLNTLLATPGSNASLTNVYIDGFYQEPADVAILFGVRYFHHEPISQKNGRIAQHYKASLMKTFETHPEAKFTIILEEDLDVAPDFFMYFSETKHLLEEDPSLYCISAWNDQGYVHSCNDPAMLYRIETMPGLGWLLSRKLFKEELEPQWPSPDKLWDWDMWMRTDFIRKDRECVIPDVSRTYHFGASGLNMNPYFQTTYFQKHAINTLENVVLRNVNRLKKDNYEEDVKKLMESAIPLDHSKDPCKKDFVPDTEGKVYVMYMSMIKRNDYDTWMYLAKCFKLWDLDARGFHKGLWRIWLKKNQILVVGVPFSAYSKFKPHNVVPIKKEKKKDR